MVVSEKCTFKTPPMESALFQPRLFFAVDNTAFSKYSLALISERNTGWMIVTSS